MDGKGFIELWAVLKHCKKEWKLKNISEKFKQTENFSIISIKIMVYIWWDYTFLFPRINKEEGVFYSKSFWMYWKFAPSHFMSIFRMKFWNTWMFKVFQFIFWHQFKRSIAYQRRTKHYKYLINTSECWKPLFQQRTMNSFKQK